MLAQIWPFLALAGAVGLVLFLGIALGKERRIRDELEETIRMSEEIQKIEQELADTGRDDLLNELYDDTPEGVHVGRDIDAKPGDT